MKVITPPRSVAKNMICFTTTRAGGHSQGAYSSFNLAMHVGDTPSYVQKNRRVLTDYLNKLQSPNESVSSQPLHFLNQTHSTNIARYNSAGNLPSNCDAIIADRKSQPLAVLTADCLPIAIASKHSDEYALIHAGWRGLLNGIVEKTLSSMQTRANDLSAWIGPGICQQHFEVDSEIISQFLNHKECVSAAKKDDKYLIDLKGIARAILISKGLEDIQVSRDCTYCDESLFSFRRSTHNKETECGRMATVLLKI